MSELPGLVRFPLDSGDGVPVLLHRVADAPKSAPVLLIHGASAWHDTFRIPARAAPTDPGYGLRSLVDWLQVRGYEPWLLDWRGSGRVVDGMKPRDLEGARSRLDFDQAALRDVPRAVARIREETDRPVSAVGHCMGGGILAQAIASGAVDPAHLTHVVLLTLGLFYEPPLDSRLKMQDHTLERVMGRHPEVQTIDPRCELPPSEGGEPHPPWPEALESLYARWPAALRPHAGEEASAVERMCSRVAFMYGTPYLERNLVEAIHGGDGSEPELPRQFGAIPIRMYVHGARNSRRGWAAPYEDEGEPLSLFEGGSVSAHECFRRLERVTLITGDRNQLWHRDSIDRMYEWLRRGTPPGDRIRKVIVRDYGHQDLLWGRQAWRDVFPAIGRGLPELGRREIEESRRRIREREGAARRLRLRASQESASRSERASARSGQSNPSENDA